VLLLWRTTYEWKKDNKLSTKEGGENSREYICENELYVEPM
jgi:hypothetical protein